MKFIRQKQLSNNKLYSIRDENTKFPYYCEVEYLESSGTQYIDTLEKDTTGYVYKTTIKPLSDGAWVLWFGRQETSVGYQCEFVGYNGDNKLGASIINPGVGNTIGAQTAPTNTLYNIETSSIDGNVYFSVNGTKTTAVRTGTKCNKNIYIFCINNAGTANNFISMRLYKFQMYNSNNKLVRDFIPVLDKNMRPALYDKVSENLFYNQGTGEFTTGRQIHYAKYLESTGTQYIDSGIIVSNTNTIICDYMLTNSTFSQQSVFGSRERNVQNAVQHGQYQNDGWYVIGASEGSVTGASSLKKHYVEYNKGKIYFGDTKDTASLVVDRSSQVYTTPHSLVFFAEYNEQQGGIFLPATTRIFNFIIKDSNDSIIRDFTPAFDENEIGFMVDKSTHVIYDNAGSGSFIVGKLHKVHFIKEKLPYYCEVEYLESTGTQYIDSSVNLEAGDSFNILTNGSFTSLSGTCYMGVYGGAFFGVDSGAWRCSGINSGTADTNNHSFEFISTIGTNEQSTLKIDETTFISTRQTSAGNISLFALLNYGYNCSFKMRYCKIYKNGVFVRNFIPVLDKNMRPALYDKITKQLFYNQGTGEFATGRQIHFVKYLESTGTEYIKTNVKPSQTLPFDVVFDNPGPAESTPYGRVFGTRKSSGGQEYQCSPNEGGSVSIGTRNRNLAFYVNTKNHITFDGDETVSINGTETTITTSAFTDYDKPIYLFCMNNNGTTQQLQAGKIYRCAFGNVADFRPAVDEYGVGFMFDRVEHRIYDNAGSGAFKYPDVELEYIESDGTQYIDTGLNADSNLGFELKYALTSTQNGQRFGAMKGAGTIRHHLDINSGRSSYCFYNQSNTGALSYDTNVHTVFVDAVNKKLYNDGVDVGDLYSSSFDCGMNFWLFRRNCNDSSYQDYINMRLYKMKMYYSGSLKRHFIPVLHDGITCMYDKISKTYFTNQGSGTFNFKINEKINEYIRLIN